jgi:putative hydrolase of the HAD superfamily
MLRAVVFDLDDTLYSERAYVLSGFRAVASWINRHFDIPAAETLDELSGLLDSAVRGDIFDRFCQRHRLEKQTVVKEMVAVYREHEPDLSPYDGVAELLTRLGEHYLLGLVSDGHLGVQRRKLTALGIARFFDGVVFSEELGRDHWKPSPRPFETIAEKLGVPAEQAVYVGENSLKDFLGARRAGMHTIRVLGPPGFYTDEFPPSAEYAAEVEIATLGDLEQALAMGDD